MALVVSPQFPKGFLFFGSPSSALLGFHPFTVLLSPLRNFYEALFFPLFLPCMSFSFLPCSPFQPSLFFLHLGSFMIPLSQVRLLSPLFIDFPSPERVLDPSLFFSPTPPPPTPREPPNKSPHPPPPGSFLILVARASPSFF